MSSKNNEFDVCEYCCMWFKKLENKSPQAVADAYPNMMKKVLKNKFGLDKKAASNFIVNACWGNWTKLHETDIEKYCNAEMYANELLWDVFYCSDRWSWDRVLRIQWLYQRLIDRLKRENI